MVHFGTSKCTFLFYMKKNQHLIYFAISVLLLGLYIANIEPAIERPIVLAGFSLLTFLSFFWGVYIALRRTGLGRVSYVVSFISALALIYLIALSSLNSLGLIDVAIVAVSSGLLIAFVIGPLRRRKP